MKRLEGKVALVTGSAQGMGYAIALALAAEGAKVVITDLNEQQIKDTVNGLTTQGLEAAGFQMDVTRKDDVVKTLQAVLAKWGRLDVLVNNAGGGLNTPHRLEEVEERHWDLVVDVNLKGTFLCCQAAVPIMARQGGGAIVNISALAGHWRASLAGVQYTAAKAGVEGLTRQLAYDWGPEGIRVNAVAPTVTLTGDRMKKLWSDKEKEEQTRMIQQIPLRRLSRPEEIAAAVVYLASEEASYITGITLDVCGGRYLR
ncbi:MAG: SDR family oxidoreductase [Spirochaetes bacterium]|nr:SDR family oxidoreductase [Spirochaetota bacterium]